MAFGADGKVLVSGSADRSAGTIKVWDVGTAQERAALQGEFGNALIRGLEW